MITSAMITRAATAPAIISPTTIPALTPELGSVMGVGGAAVIPSVVVVVFVQYACSSCKRSAETAIVKMFRLFNRERSMAILKVTQGKIIKGNLCLTKVNLRASFVTSIDF